MPINPQHQGSFTILDASNEQSRMGFNFGPITAVTIAGFLTAFGNLRTATNNLILGNLIQDMWAGDVTQYEKVLPTDENAKRENKALVRYQDDTNFAIYRLEIPTVDDVGRHITGSDYLDLTDTQVAAWVTAFEALCKSPDGNAVTVLDIRQVGRST